MTYRVLVVDDEALLALDVGMVLDNAGYQVVGPAANVSSAISLIEEAQPDAAILDLHLSRERSDAIADRLAEKSVPFLFLTGHGREHLPQAHAQRALLRKPYREAALLRQLEDLLPLGVRPSATPSEKTRSGPA